jgi:Tfp pilus assembly protein PilN
MVTVESIGWFILAWIVASVVVSMILGQLLRYNSASDDQEANDVLNRKQVVRYMRQHKITRIESQADETPSTARNKAGNGQ